MKVLVIDGQGGGIGKALVAAVKRAAPDLPLIALGTNAAATQAMMRAGAEQGATGENAICYQCRDADVIAGVVGLLQSNALLGEISPAIAAAISQSEARKVLLPLDRCGVHIVGVARRSMEELIADAAETIVSIAGGSSIPSDNNPRKETNS